MPNQGRRGLYHVHIRLLNHDFLARALPARLLAGLCWPANHHALAEGVKPMHEDAAKAVSVGDEQRDRGNPPHNAQHGEETAGEVALERDPGLENDFDKHKKSKLSDWAIRDGRLNHRSRFQSPNDPFSRSLNFSYP